MITKEKIKKLEEEMKLFGIKEDDIEEQFILGSGNGGQKINNTHSTVLLKHLPTGIIIRWGKNRSQADNRFFARRALVEKYQEHVLKQPSKRVEKMEKIKKQKKRRSRKSKEKLPPPIEES